MADSISVDTVDFCGALALMRAGIPVKRLAWSKKPPLKRKWSLRISASGESFVTKYLNYESVNGVLQPEDLLATDWTDTE